MKWLAAWRVAKWKLYLRLHARAVNAWHLWPVQSDKALMKSLFLAAEDAAKNVLCESKPGTGKSELSIMLE